MYRLYTEVKVSTGFIKPMAEGTRFDKSVETVPRCSLVSQTLFLETLTKLLLSKLLLGVAIVGGDMRQKESLVKCIQVIGKLCTKTYTITIHDIHNSRSQVYRLH